MIGEDVVLALLKHFLLSIQGYETEILSYRCVPGTASGARLDAWLLAERGGESVLFQVEVKNWCANSIGGIKVPVDASEEEIAPIAQRNFQFYFHTSDNARKTLKVLNTMKAPIGYGRLPVIPLIALWAPVGVEAPTPYFTVKNWHSNQECFPEFHVFSSSLYLRSLDADQLDIELPRLTDRLKHIREIIEIEEK